MAIRDPLHLDDDDASIAVNGGSDRQYVHEHRFPLHADIAIDIGGGASENRDIRADGLIEQVVLTADLHHLDQILCCPRVELAAFVAGIDEGAETDSGQESRFASSHCSEQLGDGSLWE